MQPGLFQSDPFDAPAGHPRRREIKVAFEKADAAFLMRYERYLRTFGQIHPDFIAGEVTEYYERSNLKLAEREKKALGGLYQKLMKEGVIEKTGEYRARNQGNASAVYRLK